jgi:hypothetical protein
MEEMARGLTDPTLALLEEFTVAWTRGDTPDPRDLLARAPVDEREELAALIDRFLERQPAREPTSESLAYVRSIAALADQPSVISEAPLLEARNKIGKKRDSVLEELREALELSPRDDSKLRRYYHRLESGLLEPSRVSSRVWTALESILDWRRDPTHHQPLAVTAGAFARSADASAPTSNLAASLGFDGSEEPVVWEPVDELFLGPKPS